MDAGRNPATGQIQCRVAIRSGLRGQLERPTGAARPREMRRVSPPISRPACPTIRSASPDNRAAVAYFSAIHRPRASRPVRVQRLRLGRFEPVVRAAGRAGRLRARRRISAGECLSTRQDPFVDERLHQRRVHPDLQPHTFMVKEAYGELRIPLLRDMPFFQRADAPAAPPASPAIRAARARSGPIMPASTGRRSGTSASAAITAARSARRTFPKRHSRWSRTSRRGFVDPCAPNQIGAGSPTRRPIARPPSAPVLARHSGLHPFAPDLERQQPGSEGGDVELLDVRRGHPAALDPGPVAHGRLLRHHREQRHRSPERADDRQQLLRPRRT